MKRMDVRTILWDTRTSHSIKEAQVRFGSVSDTTSSRSNGSVTKSRSGSASSLKKKQILKLAKNAKSKSPQKSNPETKPIL